MAGYTSVQWIDGYAYG